VPFKSKAQMRYMFRKHPDIAKRWKDKYGVPKGLPKHVKKVGVRRKARRTRKKR